MVRTLMRHGASGAAWRSITGFQSSGLVRESAPRLVRYLEHHHRRRHMLAARRRSCGPRRKGRGGGTGRLPQNANTTCCSPPPYYMISVAGDYRSTLPGAQYSWPESRRDDSSLLDVGHCMPADRSMRFLWSGLRFPAAPATTPSSGWCVVLRGPRVLAPPFVILA